VPTTRTHAALRVGRADATGSVAQVTAALGIAPTGSHDAGEPRGVRDPRPWSNMHWSCESPLLRDARLGDHLASLCDLVEHKRSALQQLADDGYKLDWFCFVEIEGGGGGVLLESDLVRRLGALPVALDLDIYRFAAE
jgi:hypothetical protein